MKERVRVEGRRFFSKKEKKIMLEKSNGRCAHCGTPISLSEDFTVEHVIPLSKGGTNDISNLVGLCSKCNKEKSNLIYLPSDYYRFVKREYLEELMRNHDIYCKETNWITIRNAFREDSFFVKGFPLVKKGFISTAGKKMVRPVEMGISREVKRVVYSDLDGVYEFYKKYFSHHNLNIPNDDLKEFLTDGFEENVFYILKGRKEGDILLVLRIDFRETENGYVIWITLATNEDLIPRKYEKAIVDMFQSLQFNLFWKLGGDVPMIFTVYMSCFNCDKLSCLMIREDCDILDENYGPEEDDSNGKYMVGRICVGNKPNMKYMQNNSDTLYREGNRYAVEGVLVDYRLKGLKFLEECIRNSSEKGIVSETS